MPAPQKGRKSPRAHVSLVARYRSPTAFEFVAEQCSDLSAGGMFIRSHSPAPAGTLIKLECDVDAGAQTIRGVARVVWLREVDTDGQPAGMGVKFVKLDPGGREAISAILARLGAESQEPEPAAISRRSSPLPIPPEATAPRTATLSAAETAAAPARAPTPSSPAAEPVASARSPAAEVNAVASAQPPKPPPAPSPTPSSATADSKPATARTPEAEHAGPGFPRLVIYLAAIAVAAFALYASRASQTSEPKAVSSTQQPAPASVPQPAPAEEAPAAAPASAGASATVATAPTEAPSSAPSEVAPEAEAKYVLEVATAPEGARVIAGTQTLTAPGTIDLGKLEEPVQLVAEKPGFLTATAVVDRVGFMLDEGQMRRRIELTLEQEPKRAPAHATGSPKPQESSSGSGHRSARQKQRVSSKATSNEAPIEASKPEGAQPAAAEASPPPSPAPADTSTESGKSSAKQTPMQVAAVCLASGDNACVIKALEGKAKGPRELELLIETYRTVGQTDKAEKQMQLYVDKYPNERYAANYRHMLDLHQAEGEAPH